MMEVVSAERGVWTVLIGLVEGVFSIRVDLGAVWRLEIVHLAPGNLAGFSGPVIVLEVLPRETYQLQVLHFWYFRVLKVTLEFC